MTRRKPSFDQLTSIRIFGDASYSPDGDRFAYLANTSGSLQLWLQPAGGGFPLQLTALADWRVTSFKWSPDGRRIAFAADRAGSEMHQLFVLDVGPQGSWPKQLTDLPSVQHSLAGWTADGRIVFSANDRVPTEVDPQLLDPDSLETTRLMTGALHYAAHASPDGNWLTVVKAIGNMNQDVYLVNLNTLEHELITRHEGDAKFLPADWDADSSGFGLLTDLDREFTGLAHYSVESGGWEYVHTPEHDVDGFRLSRGGGLRAVVENRDGASALEVLASGKGEPVERVALPFGVLQSLDLHPTRSHALLTFSTPREPTNVFELDLATGRFERREQAMLGGVDPDDLTVPELVSFPSFDREIPAWLFLPDGPGPHPVLVSIHGGPESQERPHYMYQGLYQYLLTQGIGVVAPNIRGSTGYGKSYQSLIHRDWGGGDLRDIEAAAQWLREMNWADSARLGIFGASYGGFATLSALSRLPEYWAAGAAAVGPSNLVTFASSVPPYWKAMIRSVVGDPDDDREMLLERSPISYVDQIRAPLLVYQGANDPRVVQAESDQMVEALRSNGLPVEYIVDEHSGHGPSDRETAVKWWSTIADFLVTHLVAR